MDGADGRAASRFDEPGWTVAGLAVPGETAAGLDVAAMLGWTAEVDVAGRGSVGVEPVDCVWGTDAPLSRSGEGADVAGAVSGLVSIGAAAPTDTGGVLVVADGVRCPGIVSTKSCVRGLVEAVGGAVIGVEGESIICWARGGGALVTLSVVTPARRSSFSEGAVSDGRAFGIASVVTVP
ncbi:MAG: hypothetical protein AAFQ66_02665, partial [Pseudomonadota bacterium]